MAAKMRAAAEASIHQAAVSHAGAADGGSDESGGLKQQQGTLGVSQMRAMLPVKLPPFKLEVNLTAVA
jgi:hypothetical protein